MVKHGLKDLRSEEQAKCLCFQGLVAEAEEGSVDAPKRPKAAEVEVEIATRVEAYERHPVVASDNR